MEVLSKDGETCVDITEGNCVKFQTLASDNEEVDTTMLLHTRYATSETERLMIQSPETDVVVLCVTHFKDQGCKELWF